MKSIPIYISLFILLFIPFTVGQIEAVEPVNRRIKSAEASIRISPEIHESLAKTLPKGTVLRAPLKTHFRDTSLAYVFLPLLYGLPASKLLCGEIHRFPPLSLSLRQKRGS